jgi:hypothetical protein
MRPVRAHARGPAAPPPDKQTGKNRRPSIIVKELRPSVCCFPATPVVVSRLQCAFGDFLKSDDAVQDVTDFRGLVSYLAKERTTTTIFPGLGSRTLGSHRLGEGGGDRVILSRALMQATASARLVKPWTRTTSKNLAGKSPEPLTTEQGQTTTPIRLVIDNTAAAAESPQLGKRRLMG